jgi:alpha,alpha-trehalase
MRPVLTSLLAVFILGTPAENQLDLKPILDELSAGYAKLEPQTTHPAEGVLKYEYPIPAGYYKQMWDWDGFFIGAHLAHQDRAKARYLQGWVMNFATASRGINADGWVPGVLWSIKLPAPKPVPGLGWFMVKPFLAQGAVLASESVGDYRWVGPIWDDLRRINEYREKTQYDRKWKLFFWESALQSGEDNNVALTNDEKDRNAILAADLNTFQLREYKAMARLAEQMGKNNEAAEYRAKSERLREAIVRILWFPKEEMFFNVRRDNGQTVHHISGSNFIPLFEGLIPTKQGRALIGRYLWSRDFMLASHGIRSLSKQDSAFNNVSMIDPYSNWQGPVWINTNYLYYLALKRYGFNKEAQALAEMLASMLLRDIQLSGSMHECYDGDTGQGLAPTAEQSENHKFPGFVGWNLLVQDMLQCELNGDCMLLNWPGEN